MKIDFLLLCYLSRMSQKENNQLIIQLNFFGIELTYY